LIATHAGAGSNPAAGSIFLKASHGVWREFPPSPTRAWEIENSAKLKHTCLLTYNVLPYKQKQTSNGFSCRAS